MKKMTIYLGVGALLLSLSHLGGAEPVAPKIENNNQRYMMFSPQVANGAAPEIYVIDTHTGRIWKRTLFNDVNGIYMLPLPYLSADQTSASATPTGSEAMETLSLQKQYNVEILRARQRAAAAQQGNVAQPQVRNPSQQR